MDEELYSRALEIAGHEEKVSVMFFQRKMGIGWGQAQRIVMRMVEDQIISAPTTPGVPLKVLPR